jgi:arylsulfatase A-like enzyme
LRQYLPSLKVGLALLPTIVFGISSCIAVAVVADNPKPNIVFILADDLGIGDLGVTGQNARAAAGLPAISTPNIDALAAQGMSFTRMYSGAPICSPSRASLLTGFEMTHVIKEHTDQHAEQLRAGEQDKTWGQMLQSAGYETGMFGKWHLGGVDSPSSPLGVHTPHATPPQKGFETTFGSMNGGYRTQTLWENDGTGGMKQVFVKYTPEWPGPGLPYEYSEDVTARRVAKFVQDNAGAQPFAAYVAFEAPHEPLDRLGPGQYAGTTWPDVQKRYAAMVTNLDKNVGQILTAISDPNNDGNTSDSVASNTIVVFASDNGALWTPNQSGFVTEFFDSNGPYRGEKTNTLEGGIRTPFIVRWEGVTTPGSVNDSHVGNFSNIYPTFAELAGQETPIGQDGVSMLSAITGQGEVKQQDALVWLSKDNFLNQASWAVQMGDWKLRRRTATMSYELYHIAADPFETTNLADSRTDIRDALHEVSELEGALEEPFFVTNSTAAGLNVFFTQYKTWAPQGGSADFASAANWSPGTQRNRTTDPDAKYWNSGPASNWLATIANTAGGFQNAAVTVDAQVLGMDIRGDAGVMQVTIAAGAALEAYNGARISDGGVLRLDGGTLTTAKEVEVQAGGMLAGAGTINGYQSVVAGIPEFAGKGLLEPEVRNAGVIDISQGNLGGLLTIEGDFEQTVTGELHLDLFAAGVGGSDYDKLSVTGKATLQGSLVLELSSVFSPLPGQSFSVLTAGDLIASDMQLEGPDAEWFNMSVVGGTDLVLTFASADFDGNGMVDADDLLVWQNRFGGAAGGLGDADNDGDIDGADFLTWQRQVSPSGSASQNAAVPEPSGLALGSIMAVIAALRCRPATKWLPRV